MTAEEMLERARDLELRAARKERQAEADWTTVESAEFLRRDSLNLYDEARVLRRKAERLTVGAT